jgi:hypothetical protein
MNVLNLAQYEMYLKIIPATISLMKLPYKILLY